MASPSPAPGQTNLGVAPNVGGLLCYVPCCIGFIFSVVAAIVEKQSKFVRFHAFQSLLLHAAWFVLLIGVQILSAIAGMASSLLALLVSVIGMAAGLAFLGACIFLMIKANGNEELELPVIGEMARKWA
jgi:uncharacterized membrane protein